MFRSSTLLFAGLFALRASAAEPQVIHIKTLQAQMRYDVTEFIVEPGAEVKIVLENVDDMPHNLVLFQAGTDVVAATNKNMEKPEEALKRDWLPDDPRMLAHSKMVQPKSTDEFVFKAPEKTGYYPYVCTFPGHALSMQGKMRVSAPGPRLTELTFAVYLGEWKNLPDFSKLKPHREGEVPDNLLQLNFDDYKNHYGIVFTGQLKAPREAEYTFFLTSDDGSRLLIDDKEVVAHDGLHPAANIQEGKVKLTAGQHHFRLEYFQAGSQAEIYAAWAGGGFLTTPLSKWVPDDAKVTSSKKKKEAPPPMPLVVGAEPVIYRNFIAGAGSRGIGVGYPGGFNVAWSAGQMNLALVWRGAFMDAGRHWTGRGGGAQGPLGFDAFRPAGELSPPLAVLASTSDAWPMGEEKKSEGFAWKGYTLDARRFPTFLYEWKGVKIAERFDVQGDAVAGDGKLVRTLTLTGPIPANTYFRVATGASLQPMDGGFLVQDGRLTLDGRDFENQFRVAADGAQVAGKNLLVPAQAEIKITYSWTGSHAHHAH
jgi:azurin